MTNQKWIQFSKRKKIYNNKFKRRKWTLSNFSCHTNQTRVKNKQTVCAKKVVFKSEIQSCLQTVLRMGIALVISTATAALTALMGIMGRAIATAMFNTMRVSWWMVLKGSCPTHIWDIKGDIQNMGEARMKNVTKFCVFAFKWFCGLNPI